MPRLSKSDVELWLEYGIDLSQKRVLISGEVDEDFADRAIKGLALLDQTKPHLPLSVWLNCPGGDTTQGMAVYDAIRSCKSEVIITVYGECYSMGAWILQAADLRRMMPNSKLMIHVGSFSLPEDHPGNHKAWINDFELDEQKFNEILRLKLLERRADVTSEQVAELIKFDTILTPEQAVLIGLADEVVIDD